MKQLTDRLEKEKIIAIVRNVPRDKLIPLCRALYDGGIRLVECAYDARGVTTDQETACNIQCIVEQFGDAMTVGAGTVLTAEQVTLTREAGGKFIISPDTNAIVIQKTKSEGLLSIPGALTPSEITLAMRSGADYIKLFPANAMAATDYIKAISAPLTHVKFLAVGGVEQKNIAEFLKAGFCGVGIGSGIVKQQMLEKGDYRGITSLAAEFVRKAKEF